MLSKEELIEFETHIGVCFDDAQIRAPVHLYHGNEEEILKVFQKHNIGKDDWVLCSWRSHYQCLLKGVPPAKLKALFCRRTSFVFGNRDGVYSNRTWCCTGN